MIKKTLYQILSVINIVAIMLVMFIYSF